MSHGGSRQGAGRKPGQANKIDQEAREAAVASGITPLEYMLNVLRDEQQPNDRRDWAAEKAAPYVHAKLASVESKHDVTDALADLLKAIDGRTRGLPSTS
jgi:hypothetical protein